MENENYITPEVKMNVELTPEEKLVILNITRRMGCDRDGDILSFLVKSDANTVMTYRPNTI